ncbi:glycolate oxidase subunit GlcE [Acidihalobacter ferrooxydans]|uniref:Glycolate oxidase subunit GlcE n=1 Tax=Acidihalobacter ferrooxydans TaxID=1765967 RepID=A0A1P8UDS9_9GAMM|nr:glycolate oxidase subunit GlcE [Acidihalobacter ferrooxydans]APZ42005.1 glycolate oxidase subunit GlcE [Acidihalobacter ferrooxydans]
MPRDQDLGDSLATQVAEAAQTRTALRIEGAGSKGFLGHAVTGETLAVAGHRGVIAYEPVELVLTARAGTPLAEIEALLAEHRQMLAFEPPHYGADATLGGTLACNLSGPRRPYAGAARDFVLGTRIVNGRGEILRFGGEVMKNVAGYDLSRLMAGSYGTLGVLLDISLKVLPRPPAELTLAQEMDAGEALRRMNEWAARPLPLSGAFHDGACVYLRLSGAASAVAAAQRRLGGEPVADADALWHDLREHRHGFFRHDAPLWRLSVAATAALAELPGRWLLDWGGAQRWYAGPAAPEAVRRAAAQAHGHATLYRGHEGAARFHPLAAPLAVVHRRLKAALDPAGILNPGRLYPELEEPGGLGGLSRGE